MATNDASSVITPGGDQAQTETINAYPIISETVTPEQAETSLATPAAETPTSDTILPTQTSEPLPPENVVIQPTQQVSAAKTYPVFGMQLNYLTPAEGIVETAAGGTFWVQSAAVSWQAVETNEGVRNWAALAGREQEWVYAANLGLMPVVTIHFTPAWAQKASGVSCGPIRKEKFDAFGNFLFDLVARYSQPPYNIKYWQIWNEADAGLGIAAADSAWGCWGDTGDQKYYGGDYFGKMLKTVYPRIKAADPQAQVLIAGLLLDCDPYQPPEEPAGSGNYKDCSSSRFLEGILSAGAGDYFDGISYHSYDYYQGELGKYYNPNWHSSWDKNGAVLTEKTSFIRRVLSQYGVEDKSLFNTESSVICGKTGEEAVCTDNTFVQTKAYYVAEAYAATLAENLDANFWFSLKGWRASGLLDASMQPVPAYIAYQFASRQFQNHFFTGYITDFSGVKVMAFQGVGQRTWLLWSQDGNTHSIELSETPAAIYNVYGEAQPLGTQIAIAQAPIYIVWQP
ncbi:MAG: hypothetical protein JW908_10410 [Anaerolineales bacterium]|nr:hypothetical protein [Anaerolineales bacterium]